MAGHNFALANVTGRGSQLQQVKSMEWCVPKHVPPDSKLNNFSSTKLHNSPIKASEAAYK